MITEAVLNVLFSFLTILLELLPEVDFAFDANGFSTITNILRMVCYFLPMGTVSAILAVVIALNGLRITVSIVKTIWELLPFF